MQQADVDTRCRFVFLGLSLVREVLMLFVHDVVRLTKADAMPSLQLQELRKFYCTTVGVSTLCTPSLDLMID